MLRCFLSALVTYYLVSAQVSANSVGALYSITNDPRGNSILVSSVGSDGKLTFVGAVPTGGKGLKGISPPAFKAPDPLFSQGSVTLGNNRLYVVNPGSNSISSFAIEPQTPLKLRMIGAPVNSGGDFPVSIAVSPKTNDVCVLNGGTRNGLICFSANDTIGLKQRSKFYDFGLNLTNPPHGPTGGPSQMLFTDDGTKLRAAVKGLAGASPTDTPLSIGYIATWDVSSNGTLSPTFTKTFPTNGTGIAPFAITKVRGARNAIIAADPLLGATVFDLSKPNAKSHVLLIKNQIAVCWVKYSETTDAYFLVDVETSKIHKVTVDHWTLEPKLVSSFTLPEGQNPLDIVIISIHDKEYLYVLSPKSASYNVFSIKRNSLELIQTLDFGSKAKGVNITMTNLAGAAVHMF